MLDFAVLRDLLTKAAALVAPAATVKRACLTVDVATESGGCTYTHTFDGPLVETGTNPVPEPSELERLYPFAPEFGPMASASPDYASMDDLWQWSAPNVPVMVEPRMNGFTGVLEKKGAKVKLWLDKEPGTDHSGKWPALKEFVMKGPHDFVAEVNVGLERDGVRLAQPEQEAIKGQSLPPDGDKLVIMMSDLVFMNEDVHGKQAAERYEMLEKLWKEELSTQPEFRIMPSRKAMDEFQVKTGATWARDFPGSEGARVKKSNSVYSMKGTSEDVVCVGKDDLPTMGIYKSDKTERIVYAVVLRPELYDAQEDIMDAHEVRKAAHHYLEHGRVLGFRHKEEIAGAVLESYIAPVDFKLGSGVVKKGDWVMAVRVDDQGVWDAIEAGELQAFSVGGKGTRQDV